MYSIHVKNVNEALQRGVMMLKTEGKFIAPRNIPTLEMPHPVATVYKNPTERVMLIEERDANPFFHLFESLWILEGRQDVEWLAQFNKQMREYSDDGQVFHAPYGYRLRYEMGFDQIETAIRLLKQELETRQAVLQIWNAALDLGAASKDIPCNDLIFLKVRNGRLNITVCNRSNDMIWGAYGANVVQFSMIQEYMANKIGVEVGTYTQVSDSFHVYPDNPKWETLMNMDYVDDPYKYDVKAMPIGAQSPAWDLDLKLFCSCVHPKSKKNLLEQMFSTFYFRNVVVPMYIVWAKHKHHKRGLDVVDTIAATDWRQAAINWLKRRES